MLTRWKSIVYHTWGKYFTVRSHAQYLRWLFSVWFVYIVAIVFHLSALQNDYLLDDFTLIVANPFIAHWDNISILLDPQYILTPYPLKCGARPLTVLSLMIDFRIWDNTAFGYHFTNIVFHGFNSVGVLILGLLLQKKRRWGVPVFAALVFAIHPLQNEVVNIPSFRADILVAFFYIYALIFLLAARKTRGYAAGTMYAGMIGCFLMALFCKENAITLPVAFLLLVLIVRGRAVSRRLLMLLVSSIIIATAFLIYFWSSRYDYFIYEVIFPNIQDNLSPVYSLSVYLSTILVSLQHHVIKLLCPCQLSIDYVIGITGPLLNVQNVILCAICLLATATAIRSRDRIYRFGFALFVLTYLPVSNIIPLFNTVNDRYVYLPMIGFSFMLAALVGWLPRIGTITSTSTRLVAGVVILIAYGALTLHRNDVFRNSFTLYSDAVKYAPNNIRVHYNLGIAYLLKRMPDKENYRAAIREFEAAYSLNPSFKRDDAWFCTGLCYQELGDLKSARKYFLRSFLLSHKKEALDNYADIFWQENKIDTAASLMQISAENYPDACTYNNLGVYYFKKNKWDKSVMYFSKAIDLKPNFVNAWNNLLEVYRRKGDNKMADKKIYQMIAVLSKQGAQIRRLDMK